MTKKTSPFIEVETFITRTDLDFNLATGKGEDVEDIPVVAELDYDGEFYFCLEFATVKEDHGVFRSGDKIRLTEKQREVIARDYEPYVEEDAGRED